MVFSIFKRFASVRQRRREKLIELARILLDEESLLAEVIEAFDKPGSYFSRFKKDLRALRGIAKPSDDLPWIALIDGLERRDKLVILDHRCNSENDAQELSKIIAPFIEISTLWNRVDSNSWNGKSTKKFLNAVVEHFPSEALSLIALDDGGDTHNVACIPTSKLSELEQLVVEVGYGRILRF